MKINIDNIYKNYKIGDKFVCQKTFNIYQINKKFEIPNVIMGYFAGSKVQIFKFIEFENISNCENKNKKRLYCSHNIDNKIRGNYIGYQCPIMSNWTDKLFIDKISYDNKQMKKYIKYLQKNLRI